MWLNLSVSGLFVLLTAYFFVFPLSKKRPVLIQNKVFSLYTLLLIILLYIYVWTSVPVALTMLLSTLFTHRSWLVYGVTEENIINALKKAATATRAPLDKDHNTHIISDSIRIRIFSVSSRLNFIFYKQTNRSKKAKLTKVVLKKFIQNYFI